MHVSTDGCSLLGIRLKFFILAVMPRPDGSWLKEPAMRQTVVVLQGSAETVRLNANKLQKLVGQFEVSDNGRGEAA